MFKSRSFYNKHVYVGMKICIVGFIIIYSRMCTMENIIKN